MSSNKCIYSAFNTIKKYIGKTLPRTNKLINKRNKGADGEQIEEFLGLNKNNKSVADFVNGELKTISLKF